MEREEANLIKHREIHFTTLRPDDQAHDASLLLNDVEGIQKTQRVSPYLLLVTYDVSKITLNVIDELLTELGYHLSSKLFPKLKRALYYYTEETQRINLGLDGGCKECVKLFINRYQRLQHGCRDDRPEHWRNYR